MKLIITDKRNYIDIKPPLFLNLRWVLEVEDYPDGEIAAIFFLGMLRSKRYRPILVGDWLNQSFDLSRFSYDIIPPHIKKLARSETCYNMPKRVHV